MSHHWPLNFWLMNKWIISIREPYDSYPNLASPWFIMQFSYLLLVSHEQIYMNLNLFSLRGFCTSYPRLACFVLYLKIINTLKIMYAFYSKFSKELKNGIESLVGQTVFKVWIKTFKIMFGSVTQIFSKRCW